MNTTPPRLEPLEPREAPSNVLGTTWPQPGGPGTPVHLTYSLGDLIDGGLEGTLSPAAIGEVIAQALGAWAAHAPFVFTEVPAGGDLAFSRSDLPGPQVGRAFGPGPGVGGDVTFDTQRPWGAGGEAIGSISLARVAEHEIGHALGLDHEDDVEAVMNRVIEVGEAFTALFPDDVQGIQGLYGAGVGSVDPLEGGPDEEESPPTAFARDGVVSVRGSFRDALLQSFTPFEGYRGQLSLAYAEDGTLSVTADNGHVKTFGEGGEVLSSFIGVPRATPEPSSLYAGYYGGVETTSVGGLRVTLATQGGHVKAFDAGGNEVASFIAYEGHAGEVRLGAGRGQVVLGAQTPEGNTHVKAFDAGGTFGVARSFVRAGVGG